MPAKRLSMRKIKEVLRLNASGISNRKIARSLNQSRPSVANYLRRAADAGLAWPLPPGLSDTAIEQRLFPPPPTRATRDRTLPDWQWVFKELKHKGVTQFLLWQEYLEQHPRGYQYSWFCDMYREWRGKLDVVMRWVLRSGGNAFAEYGRPTGPHRKQPTCHFR